MRFSKKAYLLLIVLILSGSIKTYSQAGGSAVPFLTIAPDARASGMGEVGVAIADDINAIYWNPGGLAFLDYFKNVINEDEKDQKPYRQVALSFSPWLPQFNADLYYSYGTIGQHIPEMDGTVALNMIFMNLGEFTRTAENGQVLGKFISNEFSLGLSYGTIIAPDLGVGFQLRYIQSNLTPTSESSKGSGGSGVSAGFDLGILYKPKNLQIFGLDLEDNLGLGMNLQNVGPKMTYIKESDPLPTMLRMGASYTVVKDEFNDMKIAFDFAKMLVKRDSIGSHTIPRSFVTAWQNQGIEFSLGMEYWYEKIVALRAGYFTEPPALGNRKYWNFGAGVKYDIFRIDFSFINAVESNSPLANTMRFSFLVDWQ